MALWAAKANEDATQPLWGRASALLPSFRSARNFYVTAGSTGDLVAVPRKAGVFNGAMLPLAANRQADLLTALPGP
jgi:hypothetical protein